MALRLEVKPGNIRLGKEKAYYVDENIEKQFATAGIDGQSRNKFFLEHSIIIDFEDGRFGVKK